MNVIKPNAIHRGDTIGVVVPAGPVKRDRIELALDRLHNLGFRTKTYGDIWRSSGYLAGDDATRAAELMAAFADPDTSAVWCARGGYGVARILERIDFDVIRRNPKVFVGFSDITALHIAIQNRTGLVTFHGPNLQDGFGSAEDMRPASKAALWRAIVADEQAAGQGYSLISNLPNSVALTTISSGVATGRLTGGNLAVLCGLIGTPFEIDTAGRILFLEDINEEPYRVDRYLAQLSLSGKLQSAAGILLGDFCYDDATAAESDAVARDVLHEYLGGLDIPVLAGFPAGHQKENFTLPVNAMVELVAGPNRRDFQLLDAPVGQ